MSVSKRVFPSVFCCEVSSGKILQDWSPFSLDRSRRNISFIFPWEPIRVPGSKAHGRVGRPKSTIFSFFSHAILHFASSYSSISPLVCFFHLSFYWYIQRLCFRQGDFGCGCVDEPMFLNLGVMICPTTCISNATNKSIFSACSCIIIFFYFRDGSGNSQVLYISWLKLEAQPKPFHSHVLPSSFSGHMY